MDKWLEWIIELQSIAQNGLTYANDEFDKERYARLRDISAEMIANQSDIPLEKVKDLFCNEIGYQTPKISTRAAIFKDDKILLVHENNGTWALPGGWCDVLESVGSNNIKEVKEETGLNVINKKVIAIHDGNKHNASIYPYRICKIFIMCEIIDGEFKKNIETTETKYFSLNNLPENIANEKCTKEQIKMCFKAKDDDNWKVELD